MSMTDPIADFLTHLRNAIQRRHATVNSPASKIKLEIAKVLKKEGFIDDWSATQSEAGHPRIVVNLKYDGQGDSIIRGLKRVSRPGLRLHAGYEDLAPVYSGQGIAVVSTSKGLLTDFECREQKIGGEVLCHVW